MIIFANDVMLNRLFMLDYLDYYDPVDADTFILTNTKDYCTSKL